MKYKDQQKKMKMRSGGVAADIGSAGFDLSGFEARLQEIGKFAERVGKGDGQILDDIRASKQAQEFLSSVGGVSIPPNKQVRKPRPIRGARPIRTA
jgi:diaminopimelate decarboxylase|tara:strand:+ start:664 stop:951 length:288 start_codon:yes stop_codon:yes gene_type:complete